MLVSPISFQAIPQVYGRSYKECLSDAYLNAGDKPAINVKMDLNYIDALNIHTQERKDAKFDNNGNMTKLTIYKPESNNEINVSAHKKDFLYRQYYYLAGSRVPSVAIEYDGTKDKIKEVTIYNNHGHRTQPKYRDDNFQYDERQYANVGTKEYTLEPLNQISSINTWAETEKETGKEIGKY